MNKNLNWNSTPLIRRIYRAHCLSHAIQLVLLLLCGAIIGFHILFISTAVLGVGATGINLLFLISVIFLITIAGLQVRSWANIGFRRTTLFQRWEKNHPELANRISMMIYAVRNPEEVERLGYSTELLNADDRSLSQYFQSTHLHPHRLIFRSSLLLFLWISIPTLIFWSARTEIVSSYETRILDALTVRFYETAPPTLRVPETLTVLRGQPVSLQAAIPNKTVIREAFIHLSSRNGWQTLPAVVDNNHIQFDLPALRQSLAYYFSTGKSISNRGMLVPLDPPAIAQGTIQITPPAYTESPTVSYSALQPLVIPEGSQVDMQAAATAPLTAATFVYADQIQPVPFNGSKITTSFIAVKSDSYSFQIKDQNQLQGESPKYTVSVIPDGSPTAEILEPKTNAKIPSHMMQRVQAHIKDDYRITRITANSVLNDNPNTARTDLLWSYSPEEAKKIGSSTDFFITYEWDLSKFGMFPGDELTFHLEVLDNDALHGAKCGRSDILKLKYASLVDLLDELDEQEKGHIRELGGVVDEQRKLNENTKKIMDKITEKKGAAPTDQPGGDDLWSEKKELQEVKEHQQKLVEEAKKIAEELAKYPQNTDPNLSAPEKEQKGFTPETLEKIDKIHDLLQELVDKDSQQLIQKIESTIDQLSRQIPDEKLEDLQFSMADFEKQLDRSLSMLESAYQARQMEGLRQMTEELAERQDHLRRETEQLAEQKQELESQKSKTDSAKIGDATAASTPNAPKPSQAEFQKEIQEKQKKIETQEELLQERQERIREDAEHLLEAMKGMQEAFQKPNPSLAQNLQQMQEQLEQQQLTQEMMQAGEQLKQRKTKQAVPHQQNAFEQLQSLSQQFQKPAGNMGNMSLQLDTVALQRLVDRCLFLSENLETVTDPEVGKQNSPYSFRLAQAFLREFKRIENQWDTIAKTNPFMNRLVYELLLRSEERLEKAVSVGQGVEWIGYHESRQSLMALNGAIYKMLADKQKMEQMMSQTSSQQMQQQMQQMISQQQNLSQMLDELRKMGESGEKLRAELEKMAQQQARIRKEIEKMMQQYRHVQQLRNRLTGIYQEMKDTEKLLNEGTNDTRVQEKQKRIMTRMLEAGTMQEQEEWGEQRKEVTSKTGLEGGTSPTSFPVSLKEQIQQATERPTEEKIPPQYREAIKQYYTRLANQVGR